jgi:hypothetical protein
MPILASTLQANIRYPGIRYPAVRYPAMGYFEYSSNGA